MSAWITFLEALGALTLMIAAWHGAVRARPSKPWYNRHAFGALEGFAWLFAVSLGLIVVNRLVGASAGSVPAPALPLTTPTLTADPRALRPPDALTSAPVHAVPPPLRTTAPPSARPVDLATLYQVKSDKLMGTFKRTVDVELTKRESVPTLEAICHQLKVANSAVVDRTFLNFDVRGEPKPAQLSHWAIARFDPELDVRILGDE